MLRTNLFSIDLKFGGNANFQLLVRAFTYYAMSYVERNWMILLWG